MKLAVLATAASASADVRDDEALANDLRAAFGDPTTHCRGDHCRTELRALTCAGRQCTAFDTLDQNRPLLGRGAAAVDLGDHLRASHSDQFVPHRTSAWLVLCSAEAGHGHCRMALEEGDLREHVGRCRRHLPRSHTRSCGAPGRRARAVPWLAGQRHRRQRRALTYVDDAAWPSS
jgi:hypothetical protein